MNAHAQLSRRLLHTAVEVKTSTYSKDKEIQLPNSDSVQCRWYI